MKIFSIRILGATALLIGLLFSGCRIFQPSVMLRTGKAYKYSEMADSMKNSGQYRINYNDELSFRLYSNDGFKLIEFMAEGGAGGNAMRNISGGGGSYKVDYDGTVKLPLLRRTKLLGMTVREAELFLEDLFAEYYNNPYAIVEVTNRRVTIFPGAEGTAKVLSLQNERTTLFEALAYSGGIASQGKAWKIKLIRKINGELFIYKIDLSKIDNIADGNIVLQGDDIIYIEPVFNVPREVLNELTPIVSLISTTLVILTLTGVK